MQFHKYIFGAIVTQMHCSSFVQRFIYLASITFALPVENTLVETEYSLKFDESMTEDEIEERSFRSLLPSEAHRRGTKDKSRHHDESEDDGAIHSVALVPRTHNILKVRRQCGQRFANINSCVFVFNNKDSKIYWLYILIFAAYFLSNTYFTASVFFCSHFNYHLTD